MDEDLKFEKQEAKAEKRELRKWFKQDKDLEKAYDKGKQEIRKKYPKFYD
jgi:hypothetical protein